MKYAPYRREDYIQKTVRNTLPKRLLFFDTETTQVYQDRLTVNQVFRLGVFIYVELDDDCNVTYRQVERFTSPETFIEKLLSVNHAKKRILVFAHNIKFDIETLNLPERFYDMGFEHKFPISNGKTFIWRVKTPKGTFVFCDTANYTATNLRTIGKDIGLEKLKVDFTRCTQDELFLYCENDVMICERFVLEYIRFIHHHDLGEFKLTIASQAFTSWRYRFMTQSPKLHKNDDVNLIEKKSYFGGRTECFRIHEFEGIMFHKVDINSQYPFCMLKDKIPYEYISTNNNPTYEGFLLHLKYNYIIANCIVRTDKPIYPVRSRNKVFFPTGTLNVNLHSPELQYALDNNLLVDVQSYVLYRSAPLFREFIEYMYGLKVQYQNEGNKSFRFLSKIFQNSLYGRFGQLYRDTIYLGDTGLKDFISEPGHNQKEGYDFLDVNWFGKLYRTFATGLATYSFPAIAGAITSHARMLLLFYIEIAGWENTYYVDTDSLIVNDIGFARLSEYINPDKIGYLKHEGSSDRLMIYGAKDYIFGEEKHHKGVPESAIEISKGLWLYDQFEGFKTWLNRGASGYPQTWRTMKLRLLRYDKGRQWPDGTITPHVMTVL